MIYHIHGTVRSSNTAYYTCLNYSKLRVRVYSVGYETLDEIGDTGVDEEGFFSLEPEYDKTSIVVKLFHADGDPVVETFVDESDVFCAHDSMAVDFVIDESLFLPNVFDTIYDRVRTNCFTPTVETLAELSDENLTKAGCLTCVTEQSLRRFQTAYRLFDEFMHFETSGYSDTLADIAALKANEGITLPLLFALVGDDYTISLADVFTHSGAQFADILLVAKNRNEIAESLANTDNKNRLVSARNGLLFNSLNDASYYDAKLIHLSDNTYAAKKALLNDALNGGGLSGIIAEELSENSAELQKVIPLITLDRHLDHYPPLLKITVDNVGDHPDYYQMALTGPSFWMGIIEDYPASYASAEAYAIAIDNSISEAVPSGRLSRILSGSSIVGALSLIDVLDAHRDFNITEHSVSAYFSMVETDPNYLAPETMLSMQRLQRSVKLSGDRENLVATKVMLDNNLSSSYAVTRKGKAGFADLLYAEASIPKETADKIYCRAEAMNSTISMLMAQYKRYESAGALMPFALSNPNFDSDPLPNLPDLESLFGNLDSCNCSECQSVYSPAAYLTDLLYWLGTSVVCSGGDTGFDALMQQGSDNRRKDLRYLKLNCKNTNTLVPYIDLVNEILSANMLIDAPGYTAADVITAYETLQTTGTADERLTEPEHRFPDAEALLKQHYFQWALPYDAAYDASTAYLRKLNKPYADLIRDFSTETDQYSTSTWANAFLGLNPEEAQLIANPQDSDPLFWKTFWGLESTDLIDNVASPATPGVGAILKSAGISLSELEDLLGAYYINGSSQIALVPYSTDECDVDKYTFLPKFTEDVADRFMRFLRLKRKTGLSTAELDLAIRNHGPANGIDQSFLNTLASCMAFARRYAIDFEDVEVFYNAEAYSDLFDPTSPSEYYKNKFLNPLLPDDTIAFFSTGIFALETGDLTNAHKQLLAKMFRVSIPDIDAILAHAFSSSIPITLTELATMQRYATFVRVVQCIPSELHLMLTYAGDPFASMDVIKAMWTVCARHRRFYRLGIRLSELLPIIQMNGIYDITSPDVLAKAEELWNEVEKAYTLERQAHPEKAFDDTTHLPVNYGDEVDFMQLIADHIRIPFNLSVQNTLNMIRLYSENTTSNPDAWLSDYVKDPEGILADRTWANRSADFLPVYQLLMRASLMSTLFSLDDAGLQASLGWRSYPALNTPVASHFFWHTHYVPSVISIDDLSWVKEMTEQASWLDMSQTDYLNAVSLYYRYYNLGYDTISDAGIVNLYDLIGEDSIYTKLSVAEFTQTFLRAQLIDGTTNDLVWLMRTFNRIHQTTDTLGYNVADSWSWVWDNALNVVDISDFDADIRRVLHNKYSDFDTWSEVIVPVQNELRSNLRNALVAFYIGQRGFRNDNAIYAYYLLDTQMAPCNQTSRIVAAISSAQLLVHRALLGIEADVCMDDDDKNEWEWRKNYRVWEANRKVFLYPENWIDPSLRNNKTTLFKNTEDLLQQDEINQQNSELAFATYLTGLNDVAHLDIRATYMEVPESTVGCCEAPPETLHVFARSWNPPYIHYYRRLKNNVWSAWEKMELETDSDHLIPVMFNRKLYLFFPMFLEKQHQTIKVTLNGQESGAPYLEVKMCYTKLDFGKWSNKKVLNGTLFAGPVASANIPNTEAGLALRLTGVTAGTGRAGDAPVYRGNLVWDSRGLSDYTYVSLKKEAFFFWPQVDGTTGDLTIHCRRDFADSLENYHDGYTEMAYEWGFRIGACDEKVEIVPPVIVETDPNAKRIVARPYMTLPYYQQLKRGKDFGAENPTNDAGLFTKTSYTHAPGSVRTLKKTNGEYVLTYPAQFKNAMKGQPYFFADKRHSLYVNPAGKFSLHEHPFTCKMLEALNRFGVDGLLNSADAAGLKRQAASLPFFATEYNPMSVPGPYPVQDYDFSSGGAYALYNWEVFFHTVSLIARQLRQSNRFEDALKWINYIFDPSNRDVSLQDLRYWKIKPFLIDVTKGIPYYMRLLSAPNLTTAEKEEKKQWEEQIEIWRDHPFDPHLIASMRPRAYMLWTVMELIDILSDWGDFLFRQDTTESINEAINLYVLASEILGERPKKVDRPAPPEYTYDDILSNLTAISTASANFENYMTGLDLCQCRNGVPLPEVPCSNSPALSTLPELGFCIPDNPRLTEMWDRVEDRLFKIRNCMNIDGKKRQVALFAPPIDPALLVRATAMGLDLSDVLSDLSAAPPHYRFSYLLQRANDFTNEVKSLGSQLLSALEKKDGEELSVLRQIHEQNILKASRTLKELQLEEAKQNYSTLQYSKNLIQIRLDDYKNREYKNSREENAQRQTQLAENFAYAEQGIRLVAGFLNLIPDPFVGAPTSAGSKTIGGIKISKLIGAGAGALGILASINRNKASMSLTYAGYDRRQEEWDLQVKLATEELAQIDRQLLSAQIRIAVAEKELDNHDLQTAQSAEIYDWLKSKYTNQALYTWMAGQLKTLHRKSYDLAYDLAKQAQQAFYRDLGAGADAKITFGNWDSSRAGFFAGERLSIQLKELESLYIQRNTRDYELSKNISLALLDPQALEDLRRTGRCTISLPEVLFDIDHPSHYFRRIKSVGISIPGIAGPYTTVGATLTMTKSYLRSSANYGSGSLQAEAPGVESIATSTAQNDSGVFEMSFRDERYMPFEYKGAVSDWTLELSDIARQFDFLTIADVIMHLQYTAKEAGSTFAAAVKADFTNKLNSSFSAGDGLYYAINLKHDLPNEWHALKTGGSAMLRIPKERLPYYIQALSPTLGNVSVVAYTGLNSAGGYEVAVNAETVALPQSSNPLVYAGSSGSTGIVLDTDFALSVAGLSTPLPLGDTTELVLLVNVTVS